ncbi:MAG TPA: GLPGLI family protein [Sphingobacteriaceae bacterium]|nr:GLPGLI family protein [Sphingobacteriaceae bacterium]
MKTIRLTSFSMAILATLFCNSLFAQKGEPALLHVIYEFIHIDDLNNPEDPIKETMELILGETESKYLKHTKKVTPEELKALMSASSGARRVAGAPIVMVDSRGGISNRVHYQHYGTGKLNFIEKLGMQSYLVEENLPKIKWDIKEERKKIGEHMCQKAVGEYAGRRYTAWFATELPWRNGPWKLSGLPGLILEAEDEQKEVRFLFKELYAGGENESTASTHGRTTKTSAKAFERLKASYDQDPASFFQAQLPSGGPTVRTVFVEKDGKTADDATSKELLKKSQEQAKSKKPNPLELNKK